MRQFVQQQADEEQYSGEQRSHPDLALTPIRICLTEVFAEGEHDQGSDDEPAVVQPDLNSRDSSECDVGLHPQPSLIETRSSYSRCEDGLCCSLNGVFNSASITPHLRGNHDPGDTAY